MIRRQQDSMSGRQRRPQLFGAAAFHLHDAVHAAQVTPGCSLQQPRPPPSTVGRYKHVGLVDDDILHNRMRYPYRSVSVRGGPAKWRPPRAKGLKYRSNRAMTTSARRRQPQPESPRRLVTRPKEFDAARPEIEHRPEFRRFQTSGCLVRPRFWNVSTNPSNARHGRNLHKSARCPHAATSRVEATLAGSHFTIVPAMASSVNPRAAPCSALPLAADTVYALMRGGRARWKIGTKPSTP
jgi:hypothetical protein